MSPAPLTLDDPHAVHRINMSWLVRLRWAAIGGQAVLISVVEWGVRVPLPLANLATILGLELVANVGFEAWLKTRPPVSEKMIASALAFDVACFTGLLYFTGGPLNPFSFLYLVHIALAALVLRPRWTWTLVLFSVALSASLFVRHVPLPMDHGMMMQHGMVMDRAMMVQHGVHTNSRSMGWEGEPLGMHLKGMWVAFAVAAAFIVYFIHRVTRALAERESELARARERAARSERLASMATLAAGAAHELATPLSTIAIVARELERAPKAETIGAEARLIRDQVERCRGILSQMASDAGQNLGEIAAPASAEEVVKVAIGGLGNPERVRVDWKIGDRSQQTVVPLRAMAQALRNVLQNGLDASERGDDVVLAVESSGAGLRFEVTDRGAGMPADVLARAIEPFFTTKEPGAGMGLGLYLTRSVVDFLGGELDIASDPGKGTRVLLTIPGAATNGRIAPVENA